MVEVRIFLDKDSKSVLKLNDAIYYATWLEYYNSLAIHNLIFPETAYSFRGFLEIDDILYVVLQQDYVKADGVVSIEEIMEHLEFKGFKKLKRNDYL